MTPELTIDNLRKLIELKVQANRQVLAVAKELRDSATTQAERQGHAEVEHYHLGACCELDGVLMLLNDPDFFVDIWKIWFDEDGDPR